MTDSQSQEEHVHPEKDNSSEAPEHSSPAIDVSLPVYEVIEKDNSKGVISKEVLEHRESWVEED